jgi:hypothetical protein
MVSCYPLIGIRALGLTRFMIYRFDHLKDEDITQVQKWLDGGAHGAIDAYLSRPINRHCHFLGASVKQG